MYRIALRCLPFMVVAVAACTSVQYRETDCAALPSDTFWSGNVALQCQEYRRLEAETAFRNEGAQLLKDYRECLKKYENNLSEANERCSMYTQAFREIQLPRRQAK